jgi:hypothetical protein
MLQVYAACICLNSGYAAYNGGLHAKNNGLITETERLARTITFVAGANGLVMIDEYLTNLSAPRPSYRQATHQTI